MSAKLNTPFNKLLQAVGLSQVEAYDYLTACGMETTIHAVRAWCRGSYNAPEQAIVLLGQLFFAITHTDADLPPEAPAGAIERKEIALGFAAHFGLTVIVDGEGDDFFDLSRWIQSTRKS